MKPELRTGAVVSNVNRRVATVNINNSPGASSSSSVTVKLEYFSKLEKTELRTADKVSPIDPEKKPDDLGACAATVSNQTPTVLSVDASNDIPVSIGPSETALVGTPRKRKTSTENSGNSPSRKRPAQLISDVASVRPVNTGANDDDEDDESEDEEKECVVARRQSMSNRREGKEKTKLFSPNRNERSEVGMESAKETKNKIDESRLKPHLRPIDPRPMFRSNPPTRLCRKSFIISKRKSILRRRAELSALGGTASGVATGTGTFGASGAGLSLASALGASPVKRNPLWKDDDSEDDDDERGVGVKDERESESEDADVKGDVKEKGVKNEAEEEEDKNEEDEKNEKEADDQKRGTRREDENPWIKRDGGGAKALEILSKLDASSFTSDSRNNAEISAYSCGAADADCCATSSKVSSAVVDFLRASESEKQFLRLKQSFDNPLHAIVDGRIILKSGVLEKKSQRRHFSRRSRLFVLVEGPRLFYFDAETLKRGAAATRGEVMLTPETTAMAKSSEKFRVKTPQREFRFVDSTGCAKEWAASVMALLTNTRLREGGEDLTSSRKNGNDMKAQDSGAAGDLRLPHTGGVSIPAPKWQPGVSGIDEEPIIAEEKTISAPGVLSPLTPLLSYDAARSVFSPPTKKVARPIAFSTPRRGIDSAGIRGGAVPFAGDVSFAETTSPLASLLDTPRGRSISRQARTPHRTPRPRMGTRMVFPNSMILSYSNRPSTLPANVASDDKDEETQNTQE